MPQGRVTLSGDANAIALNRVVMHDEREGYQRLAAARDTMHALLDGYRMIHAPVPASGLRTDNITACHRNTVVRCGLIFSPQFCCIDPPWRRR